MDQIFGKIAEAKMKEAERKGDLKNLPGEGKPLQLENDNPLLTPEERMAQRIMKTLGLTSEEAHLKQEIDLIRKQIKETEDEGIRKKLNIKLQEKSIWYNILLEKRRL